MKALTLILAASALTTAVAASNTQKNLDAIRAAFDRIDKIADADSTGILRGYADSIMRQRTGGDVKVEAAIQSEIEFTAADLPTMSPEVRIAKVKVLSAALKHDNAIWVQQSNFYRLAVSIANSARLFIPHGDFETKIVNGAQKFYKDNADNNAKRYELWKVK